MGPILDVRPSNVASQPGRGVYGPVRDVCVGTFVHSEEDCAALTKYAGGVFIVVDTRSGPSHEAEEHAEWTLRPAVQMGGIALSTALKNYPDQTKNLFMQSYGAGTQVAVLLPYSRIHEKEADHLGLVFMAMAGYNPQEAVAFWERMAAGKKGARPPEFLSTHPANETRIQNIKDLLPEAMQYYRKP